MFPFFFFFCGCPKRSTLFCINSTHEFPKLSFITGQGRPDESSYERRTGHLFGFRRVDIGTNSVTLLGHINNF